MRRDPAEERRRYREAKAVELEGLGELEEAAAVRAGKCPCLCGDPIPRGNVRAFFVDDRHRRRHHRRRLERLAEAANVPARLTVETLRTANGTGGRSADAPARRKRGESKPRAGVSVYFPTPDVLEVAIAAIAKDRKAREGKALPSYLELADQALEASRTALTRRRART